jgi:hypothetical protein
MGLRTHSKDLFSPAWVDSLKGAPESAMDATVRLYWPATGAVYDPETNEYTTGPDEVLYEGKARVQPLRVAARVDSPGNDTTVQQVLFSIPIATRTVDFRAQMSARVLSAPLNPSLTGYAYVLREIMDSSNPIEKTLLFEVDQEKDT